MEKGKNGSKSQIWKTVYEACKNKGFSEKKKIIKRIGFAVACVTVLCVLFFGRTEKIDAGKIYGTPQIEYAHFSVDDCNGILEDLAKNNYQSIFDQPELRFLKGLHDKYGIVVSLYVFYSWDVDKDGFDLSQAKDCYREEFQQNAQWLKFGFHAADANAYQDMTADEILAYYDATIREIIRITGDAKCIDRFVRLDRYTADLDTILLLEDTEYGIDGLFIADRNNSAYRISYALTEEECRQCYLEDWYADNNGIFYTPTDIRVEQINTDETFYDLLNTMYDQTGLIIFTHEWALGEENVQRYMKLLAEYVYEYSIPSAFVQGNSVKE